MKLDSYLTLEMFNINSLEESREKIGTEQQAAFLTSFVQIS